MEPVDTASVTVSPTVQRRFITTQFPPERAQYIQSRRRGSEVSASPLRHGARSRCAVFLSRWLLQEIEHTSVYDVMVADAHLMTRP